MMFRQNTIARRAFYGMFVALLAAIPSLTEDSQPITLNRPLTVQLVPGGVKLAYTANQAQVVTLVARSLEAPGKIDPTLEVLDADHRRVPSGFDDDHHTARPNLAKRDSVIDNLSLPGAGVYTIWLNSFDGVDAGRVEVAVELGNPFDETVTQNGAAQVVRARLPAYRRYTRTFEAAAGEKVTITARDTSGTLDLLLALRDPDGKLIAHNDDADQLALLAGLDTLDAQIRDFTIPADGTYTVEVTDFTGAEGAFELTIARAP